MDNDIRRVLKDIERIILQDPHRGGDTGRQILLYISLERCRDLLEGLVVK